MHLPHSHIGQYVDGKANSQAESGIRKYESTDQPGSFNIDERGDATEKPIVTDSWGIEVVVIINTPMLVKRVVNFRLVQGRVYT